MALLLWLLLLAGGHAGAVGGRIDVYGTNIHDDSASLTLERRSLFGGSAVESGTLDAGARPEFGVRILAYGDLTPVVGSADFSVLQTGSPQLDLLITGLTLAGGLRMPTPLLAHHGRGLHPYVLAGMVLTGCEGTAEIGSIRTNIYTGSSMLSTGAADASPFLAAGVDWQISKRVGLVMEYRHRRIGFDSITTNSIIFPTENILASGHVNASGVSVGISWLFDAPGLQEARMPTPPPEPAAP